MGSSTGVAVVLPVKAFDAAKQRLRRVLDDGDRAAIARHLATGVARTVQGHRGVTLVVACDDEGVREWAGSVDATIAWTPGLGLNGAIDAGVDTAIDAGAVHLVVAHADLARPATVLRTVHDGVDGSTPAGPTVVPDRHRDGTNVMAFPASARLRADYGPGSFHRHLARARAAAARGGLAYRVLPDPDLALDVDTIDDLLHPVISKELPSWLRIHQDSHSTPVG